MSKRPKDPASDAQGKEAGDLMELTPLGAGQEVGRSCMYFQFKGKTILVRRLGVFLQPTNRTSYSRETFAYA